MANVRIKDLTNTASSTASDDFFGVDGATNGTRKLNAYSPTFGGNLTVSGAGSVTGNLGVGGVTVSSWSSPYKAIELDGANLSVYPTSDLYLSQNAYNNGGWKYKANGYASQYIQVNSEHRFLTAASGTAGNAISFTQAMTLTSGGLLLVGTTDNTNGERLQVLGNALIRSAAAKTVADTPFVLGTATGGANEFQLICYRSASGSGAYYSLQALEQGVAYRNLSLQKDGGNVLVGKTTDSGEKFQVYGDYIQQDWGSTGTNRGLIRFGKHTTYANIASISLNGDTSDAGCAGLFGGGQDNTYLQAKSGGSVVIRTNGATTALTLDASQNATFAQHITVGGNFAGTGAAISSSINSAGNAAIYGYNYNAAGYGLYVGGGLSYFAGEATFNSNAVINGVLKLGNAYVAGAPTATGYVTIKDSAGNTYKVLVGT